MGEENIVCGEDELQMNFLSFILLDISYLLLFELCHNALLSTFE
jgi:hypothetical protein